MNKVNHSINMAARKSGLTPHVIRVWERRYGAVTPNRTDTNRRLYSEEEIERLSLLRQAVGAGYRISNIATLDAAALRELLIEAPIEAKPDPHAAHQQRPAGEDFEARCLDAIQQMDAHALDDIITRALIVFGHQGLLRNVIAPLTQALGDLWTQGTITAAHEHFASAFLRNFLSNAARPFAVTENTPCIIVGTPHGQLHELGATMIASAARNQGWRVVYLGASLPAAEIAGAAAQNKARAVALSLVYPTDDPHMAQELANLRRYLPASIRILAGGRASLAYAAPLKAIGALTTQDLDMFCEHLESLRKPGQFSS